jgi:hypothetical protein
MRRLRTDQWTVLLLTSEFEVACIVGHFDEIELPGQISMRDRARTKS